VCVCVCVCVCACVCACAHACVTVYVCSSVHGLEKKVGGWVEMDKGGGLMISSVTVC